MDATENGIVEEVYKTVRKLEEYTVAICDFSGDQCLLISHKKLYNHFPFGMTSRCRISVTSTEYVVHILMREVERGTLSHSSCVKVVDMLCMKYSTTSQIGKFCPGLSRVEYDNYRDRIRFDLKSVRITLEPFHRIDSSNCLMWTELGRTASSERREAIEVLCRNCTKLRCNLEHQVRRTVEQGPSKKIKQQDPSSHARLSYMSPNSQSKRMTNKRIERGNDKRKMNRFTHTDLTLDSEQNEQLSSIVSTIARDHAVELERVFDQGKKHGVESKLRDIWNLDAKRELTMFQQDQESNKTGNRTNKWSFVTIRIALAIYSRSPAAFDALRSFNILQLPSKSTLQAYTGAFLHEPGSDSSCIADQVARYVLFCEGLKQEGKQESQKVGVLIFDEVKVISCLMWNSRSHKVIGLSMSHEELSSLADIYQVLSDDATTQQTSYILQFLWRDLTSSFDIVGPYFTCSDTLKSKFVLSCVLETVKLFKLHGLDTLVIMCDGASTNLATLKATHGHSGCYGINKSQPDPYEVKPVMINPFNPPQPIFWLICPTHQLKNMINALHASQQGGTKKFELEDVTFGWASIVSIYERECERVKTGQTRMVPQLKEVHVLRDSWTKLNVAPAKILQQEKLLSELHHFCSNNDEAKSCQKTLQYLEACSKIFEKGFLSHATVTHMDSLVLKSINEGYSYFVNWIDHIHENDPQFDLNSCFQRKFLSWQTFDLLRIDVYGFRAFCEHFFNEYPGYFVSPLRLSGSAVESLFSQYKYNSGGKLDACNYVTSRAAHLIKQTVASHHSGKGYRDKDLQIACIPLKRKEYNKKSDGNRQV